MLTLGIILIVAILLYFAFIFGMYYGANKMCDKYNGQTNSEDALEELLETVGDEPLNLEKELDKLKAGD